MADTGYKIRNPQGIYFITFAVVEWVDVFSRKQYAELVHESLKYCIHNKGLRLHAYCLMTNHLHLILSAEDGYSLSAIVRDFKKYTAQQLLKSIEENRQESRRDWMLWIFRAAAKSNSKNSHYQFWRQNNQPKALETNAFMEEKLRYVHENPVVAGYVNRPEDWVWSSAGAYAGKTADIPLYFIR